MNCRFANTIYLSNLTEDEIWKILTEKKSQLNAYLNSNYCHEDGIFNSSTILGIVGRFEKQIQMNVNDTKNILNTMTIPTLNKAAEMFMYLNWCSQYLHPWLNFYRDLFINKSPAEIVLAMNKVLKGSKTFSPQSKLLKLYRDKIFNNITSLLSLKYEEINSIINGSKKVFSNNGIDFEGNLVTSH